MTFKKLLVSGSLCCSIFALSAQTWLEVPGTLNKHPAAMIEFDNKLFLGGNFTSVDNVSCSFYATYDGKSAVKPLKDEELAGGGFDCFAVHGNKLFGGGTSTVGSISFGALMLLQWDGSKWGNSAYRLHSNVYALASLNTDLIVGGNFDVEDGVSLNHIAKHDGSSYSKMGDGFDAPVSSIVNFNNTIYVAGGFNNSGTTPVKYIAKWDGTSWSDVGGNTLALKSDLVVFKNNLYVVRAKDNGDVVLSKWDGTAWTNIADVFTVGPNGLRAIAADFNNLYIGGEFTKVGSLTVQNIVAYNGTSFEKLGDGLTDLVTCIATYKEDLYAGTFSFTATKLKKFALPSGLTKTASPLQATVYPNPANDYIQFSGNITELATVAVFDIHGKQVMNQQLESNGSLPVNLLENGMYFVTIQDKGNTYFAKFSK